MGPETLGTDCPYAGLGVPLCGQGQDQRGGIHGEALQPNMGPSLADILSCMLETTNAGFSSFPVRKPLS